MSHEKDRTAPGPGETVVLPVLSRKPRAETPAKAKPSPRRAKVGPYELRGELGRGGMGVVFRAWHSGLAKEVALKVLTLHATRPEARSRFFAEARAAARLRHANIVSVHDVGEERRVAYLAMELVEGEALAAKLAREKRLAPRESATIAVKVARALAFAHAEGILHRDVKPGNVLLARGAPLLADFGLAKDSRTETADRLTETGAILGTPAYMSPEQARGELVDRRSDVYSLGVTLYELLTGNVPHTGSTPQVLHALLRGVPPKPPSRCVRWSRADDDLETICLRAMEHDLEDRYPSADALAEDLERYLEDEPILARRPGLVERARKWRRRNRRLLRAVTGVATLSGLVLVASGGLFARQLVSERDRANEERARADEARARADRSAAEAEQQARLAGQRARAVTQVVDVLVNEVQNVLEAVPGERALALRKEILEKTLPELERLRDLRVLGDDEAVNADLRCARVASALGDLAGARKRYQGAVELQRAALEKDGGKPLARLRLATLLHELGKVSRLVDNDSPEAKRSTEEAIALARSVVSDPGAGDARYSARAILREALRQLGHIAVWEQRKEQARRYLDEAIDLARDDLARSPSDEGRLELATALLDLSDIEKETPRRLELAREGVAMVRGITGRHEATLAWGLVCVARTASESGDVATATPAYQEAIDLLRPVARDPANAAAQLALATDLCELSLLLGGKEVRLSQPLRDEALGLLRGLDAGKHLGFDGRLMLARCLYGHGFDCYAERKRRESLAALGESCTIVQELFQGHHRRAERDDLVHAALASSAFTEWELGDYRRSLEHVEQALTFEHGAGPVVADCLEIEGKLLARQGDVEKGIAALRSSVHILEGLGPERVPDAFEARSDLAVALARAGRLHEAREHVLEIEQALPALPGNMPRWVALEAAARVRIARHEEREAHAHLKKLVDETQDELARAGKQLDRAPREMRFHAVVLVGLAYLGQEETARARTALEFAISVAPEVTGDADTAAQVVEDLATALLELGHIEEDEGHEDRALELLERAKKELGALPEPPREMLAACDRALVVAKRALALLAGKDRAQGARDELLLARGLAARGDPRSAVPHFAKALDEAAVREEPRHLHLAVRAAARAGLGSQALAWLADEIELRRKRLAELGTALASAGDPEKKDALQREQARERAHIERIRAGDPALASLRETTGFRALLASLPSLPLAARTR